MVDKLIDKMLDEYTQCQHCHYFTLDVPEGLYKPQMFQQGVHGACDGCPQQPPHVEHRESTRCAWFSLRDGLRKECEMTPDEYAADATALDHADDAEIDAFWGDTDRDDDREDVRPTCGCRYCWCSNPTEYGEVCNDCLSGAHQG